VPTVTGTRSEPERGLVERVGHGRQIGEEGLTFDDRRRRAADQHQGIDAAPLALGEQIVANRLDVVLAGKARAVDELGVVGDARRPMTSEAPSDAFVEGADVDASRACE
jgi:hypothetical protein